VMLGLIVLVSAISPFLHAHFMQKWFAWPAMLFVAPVPVLVLVCAFYLFRGLQVNRPLMSFLAVQGLFVLSYIGLIISFFPYMVPSSVTLWQAAAPDNSLKFLLVGAVFLIPIILAYSAYAYWVFRGKVGPTHDYH
jgi:cytochrome d ubiquinol oxidase subunit II